MDSDSLSRIVVWWRGSLREATVIVACALVVGCGSQAQLAQPSATSPTPSSSPTFASPQPSPATPEPVPVIGEIVWAAALDPTTDAPIETVAQYTADSDQIIAVVQANGLPAGSVVEALWEYNDTSLDAFTTRLTARERLDGRWINFHLDRDPAVLWPAGTYAVTIRVGGDVAREGSIEVIGAE